MDTRLISRIQSLILIGCTVVISACATANTSETVVAKTDDSPRSAPEKGNVEPSPALPQSATPLVVTGPVKIVVEATEMAQPAKTITTRINPKEPFVNVRNAPSIKSRNIAVIMGGQTIEILEAKDVWVKIIWKKGEVVKQGWLKKRFVEGYEQNQ